MGELELTRSADDRQRYDLDGVGALRRMGVFSRTSLLLPVDGDPLTARFRGLGGEAEAVTAGGEQVGDFTRPVLLSHGGEIQWHGRTLRLRSGPVLISRYELGDAKTTLLEVRARGWGRSADVTLGEEPVDHGLVLFVLWLAQGLVDHDSGRGGATAAAAT